MCHRSSQLGFLHALPNLHRDKDIDEELKSIADLMDNYREWKIRRQLRDSRLTFVAEDPGSGPWDNGYVVEELIKRLREQAGKAPNDNFGKVSVRLFAWLCKETKWALLLDFPVFAAESSSEARRVIKLERVAGSEVKTLAPVRAWDEKLRPFAELFPQRHVIANEFYEAAASPEFWASLDTAGFCTREVVIKRKVRLKTFLPRENLTEEHVTSEYVDVTDIAFIDRADIGIMARVRQSQRLARLFWRFLTEWMVEFEWKGLEVEEALCDCGERHQYNPAEWVIPLRQDKWVPLGLGRRGQATAQTLADLLRGSGWEPSSLNLRPTAVKLLEAIGITRLDLVRAFMAASDAERKEQDDILTSILDAAAGRTDRLSYAQQYIEYLKDDEALPDVLKERWRQRRRVHDNQSLGRLVEDLIRMSLEAKQFVVRRKPIGSDFEIEHDVLQDGKEAGIEIAGLNRTWLVEVKATRGQAVRMTEKQANTAKEEGSRFLLCIVPVEDDGGSLTLEAVSAKVRFVQNIGVLVAPLCDDLSEFKGLRNDITADESSGIQLEVDAGTVRVRVAAPVWENGGFQLEDLLGRLSESV